MSLAHSEFIKNPDLVIRSWLKNKHSIIVGQSEDRPWELMSDAPGEFRFNKDSWKVTGVPQPTFKELKKYTTNTLAELEDDDDLNDIDIGDQTGMINFVLERLYVLDNPGVTPDKKKMRKYITDAKNRVPVKGPKSNKPGKR